MAGLSPLLTKAFLSQAAIGKYLIVKHGTADGTAVLSAAATDFHIGVTAEIDEPSGQNTDVHMAGIADVTYGGAVTRGQPLTSDASGRAIAAAPAAGANMRIVGFALVNAVVGDIGPLHIQPGLIQG